MSAKSAPFEWGGGKFSTREQLEDLLRTGVFKEGDAWGSIRLGWGQVMGWREVKQALIDSGAPMGRVSARMPRGALPAAAFQGDLFTDGAAVWVGQRFERALDPLWARCEAAQFDLVVKAAKASKPKGKSKAGKAPALGGVKRL
jgi:hypothetical protein